LEKHVDAAKALQALSKLQPVDPANIDLRLAQAQLNLGQKDFAKRSVLRALEIAPRYREAHQLLLEIVQGKQTQEAPPEITSPEITPQKDVPNLGSPVTDKPTAETES